MLGKIAVSGVGLTHNDLKSLSLVVANSDHIGILELINCQLDATCLKALAEGLRGSQVQIDVLDVSFNRNLRKDSLPYLYEICLRTCGLNYWQCGFKQIDLLTFDPNKKAEIKTAVSREKDITELFEHHGILDCSIETVSDFPDHLLQLSKSSMYEGDGVAVRISGYGTADDTACLLHCLQNCKVIRDLEISESALTTSQFESIRKFVGKELKVVNVFLCPDIGANAWAVLGEISRTGQTDTFLLTACGVTGQKLESLQLSIYPNQLTKLDLSRNEDMDEQCLQTLGSFVENAAVRELILAYCRLSAISMKTLEKCMSKAKLKRFDVSGNTTMGTEGFAALGSIAENCSVEQLDVSECDPVGSHLRSFESVLKNAKLVKLNVSRNRNISKDGGMDAVTGIVKKSRLQELFMRQCDLDKDSLACFKKTLGDTKLPRLDLGHYFMKDRPVMDDEIEVIVDLLQNIGEQLTLNKWELSSTQRQKLQSALDQLKQEAPTIQLDRSIDEVMCQKAY